MVKIKQNKTYKIKQNKIEKPCEKFMNNLDDLVFLGRELSRSQLISRNWGNLSCKKGDDFFITPSGCMCMDVHPDELVKVNIADGSYNTSLVPSLEREMHRLIYSLSNSVQFVAHTHQPWAGALSASGLSKLDISLEARSSIVGKSIPIIDYALPNSKNFTKNIVKSLNKDNFSKIAIIAHKGGLFFAETAEEVLELAKDLELEIQKFLVNIINAKYPKLECTLDNLSDNLLDIFIRKRHSLFKDMDKNEGDFIQELEYILEDTNLEVRIKKEPIFRVFSNLTIYPALDDFAQFIGEKIKPSNHRALIKKINSIQTNKFLQFANSSLVFSIKDRGFLIMAKSKALLFAVENILEKNLLALLVADLFAYPGTISKFESFLLRKNYIYNYSKLIHSKN